MYTFGIFFFQSLSSEKRKNSHHIQPSRLTNKKIFFKNKKLNFTTIHAFYFSVDIKNIGLFLILFS